MAVDEGGVDRFIGGVANVAISVAAVVLVWIVLTRPTERTRAIGEEPGYTIGDEFSLSGIDAVAEITMGQPTIVLYLRSTCRFCTESMGFYRRLSALASRIRLVVIGYEQKAVVQEYLAANGLAADAVVELSRQTPEARLRGTPTLVPVDSEGRIRGLWRGRLAPPDEARVVDAMKSLIPSGLSR